MTTTLQERIKALPKVCITCDGPGCSSRNPPKRCSKCQSAFYCSVVCQREHWRAEHKEECIDINKMREDNDDSYLLEKVESLKDLIPINSECAICFGELNDPKVTLQCRHAFCFKCLRDWQRSTQSQQSQSCPCCRSETEDVADSVLERIRVVMYRAYLWDKEEERRQEAKELREQAVQELEDKFGDVEEPNWGALFTKGLLLLKCDPEAAVATFKHLVDLEEDFHDTRDFLLERMDCGEATFEEFQLLKEYNRTVESGEVPPLVILHLNLAEAYIKLEDWENARSTYIMIMAGFTENCVSDNKVTAMIGFSKCSFHLGLYEPSIGVAEMVLELTRTAPDAHKYLALSLKAIGKLDEAVTTMNRAALYEAVWDDEHRSEVLDMYHELKVELEAQAS